MTFKVFNKTGEFTRGLNGESEWDGDDGYDLEIEVAEEKVHRDIAEMICNDYLLCAMALKSKYKINYIVICEQIEKIINDMDCWDKATKFYFEALQAQYQEEFLEQ